MDALGRDARFALRSLRKDWMVNLLAAVSLALALAGNATVFSLINTLLYRPLPYPEPERIVLVGEREANAPQTLTAAPANLRDLRERNRSFEQLAGFRFGAVALGIDDKPISVQSATVTADFFDVLGATAAQGRGFLPEEGIAGNYRVVVISAAFAQERLSEYPSPTGTEVMLNGEPHTVVGVMPDDFQFFFPGVRAWVPLTLEPTGISRDERSIIGVGRMRPGVTMEQLRDDMGRVWDELVAEYPESNRGWGIDILNFRHEIPNSQARILFALLQGTVLCVLLIACVNIANLLSARGQQRQREIALRTILGASHGQLLRQLLVESAILSLFAGVIGLALSVVGIRLISNAMAALVVSYWRPVIDVRVVAFSLALTVFAGMLFGIFPALQSFKVDLASTVKEGGRGVTGNARRKLLSRGLVVAEIAMSLVLLAGGSMLVRAFTDLRNSDPGFDTQNLLTAPVTLPSDVESAGARDAMIARVIETVGALPGVVEATAATTLPLNFLNTADAFTIDGRPLAERESRPRALWAGTPPGYIDVLGIPLVRGRFFAAADRADAVQVVVIGEKLAEQHWPDDDPIGQRLTFHDVSREIVGIVGDTRQTLVSADLSADAVLYVPLSQNIASTIFLMTRTAVEPRSVAAPLRTELQRLDRRLVVGQLQTLDEVVDQVFVGMNVMNLVLTGFGNLALLLAALGTYGVIAYNVAQRRQEIGVRIALGAKPREVVGLITRQGTMLGVLGLLVGAPFVWGIVRVVQSALTGFSSPEPTLIFGVAGVLMLATVIASVIPAVRASRLHPAEVLHDS